MVQPSIMTVIEVGQGSLAAIRVVETDPAVARNQSRARGQYEGVYASSGYGEYITDEQQRPSEVLPGNRRNPGR